MEVVAVTSCEGCARAEVREVPLFLLSVLFIIGVKGHCSRDYLSGGFSVETRFCRCHQNRAIIVQIPQCFHLFSGCFKGGSGRSPSSDRMKVITPLPFSAFLWCVGFSFRVPSVFPSLLHDVPLWLFLWQRTATL